MNYTQIEDIKAEAMTLARRTKHIANNLETMAQELQQITQKIDDLTLKIANLETTQQDAKPDPSDPKLIEEWVQDNGFDFDDDLEEAVICDLDVNEYHNQCTISISKEVEKYNRDSILENAITRYLEWASEQTIQSEEDTNNA